MVNTKHNAIHPTVKLSLKHPIWTPGQAGCGPTHVYERTLSYNYKIQNTLFVIIKSVVEQNIGAQKRSIFERPVVIMEVDAKTLSPFKVNLVTSARMMWASVMNPVVPDPNHKAKR